MGRMSMRIGLLTLTCASLMLSGCQSNKVGAETHTTHSKPSYSSSDPYYAATAASARGGVVYTESNCSVVNGAVR